MSETLDPIFIYGFMVVVVVVSIFIKSVVFSIIGMTVCFIGAYASAEFTDSWYQLTISAVCLLMAGFEVLNLLRSERW